MRGDLNIWMPGIVQGSDIMVVDLHQNNVFRFQAGSQLLYLFSINATFYQKHSFLCFFCGSFQFFQLWTPISSENMTVGHAKTWILRKFEEIKIQTVLQFIFPVPVFIFTQNINFWKLTSTLPL